MSRNRTARTASWGQWVLCIVVACLVIAITASIHIITTKISGRMVVAPTPTCHQVPLDVAQATVCLRYYITIRGERIEITQEEYDTLHGVYRITP